MSRATIRKADRNTQRVFKMLGDPGRFAIFKYLTHHTELCVGEAADLLDFTSSAASQHLKMMEKQDIVIARKRGRKVCYRLNRSNPLVKSLSRSVNV